MLSIAKQAQVVAAGIPHVTKRVLPQNMFDVLLVPEAQGKGMLAGSHCWEGPGRLLGVFIGEAAGRLLGAKLLREAAGGEAAGKAPGRLLGGFREVRGTLLGGGRLLNGCCKGG